MKNKVIVLAGNPRGVFLEGIIGDTSIPGTIMEIDPTVAMSSGRPTWIASNPGTAAYDTLQAILLEDDVQGFTYTTAYVAGKRGRLYVPLPGEEVNVLCGEASGTGHTYAIGDRLEMAASGGYLIPATGASCKYIAMEAIDVTGTGLVWCIRV